MWPHIDELRAPPHTQMHNCQSTRLNKHSTNIAPAALQQPSEGQLPHGGQPTLTHQVAQRWAARWASGGSLEDSHLSAYSFILWPASVPPVVPLQWCWPPQADLEPPLCLFQWHRVSFQPNTIGWIVVAGLLCANPPHVHQRPSGGPLDVNRQPPCPPL